ncbi:hypothetical protein RI054_42g149630 [Pseudoscourfieldia marina]
MGFTKLHGLIYNQKWTELCARLKTPEGKEEVKENVLKDHFGVLPLHWAAYSQAPSDVIELILHAYPEGARQPTNNGVLPLHIAAYYQAPSEVVQKLLHAYPEGAGKPVNGGYLPLHIAAYYQAPSEVVQKLLHAYPDGAGKPTNRGSLPLHLAAEKQAPSEVVQMILDAYPDGAGKTDNNGFLPLHWAAGKQAPSDVVQMILDAYPEGAGQPGKNGDLPLHYAAQFQAPSDVVQMILEAYPEGARVKNMFGNIPFDIARNNGASAEVIKLLEDTANQTARAATPPPPSLPTAGFTELHNFIHNKKDLEPPAAKRARSSAHDNNAAATVATEWTDIDEPRALDHLVAAAVAGLEAACTTDVKARRRALEQKLATARRAINAAVEEEKALAIMEERETRATAQLFPELTARREAQAHTQTQTLPPLTSPVTAIGRMTM